MNKIDRWKLRYTVELFILLCLIQAILWNWFGQKKLYWVLALTLLVLTTWLWRKRFGGFGFRPSGFSGSAWIIFAAIVVGLLLFAFGTVAHTMRPLGFGAMRNPLYPAFVVLQEFLLQGYLFLRLEQICKPSSRLPAVVAGALFALCHLPNPLLMVVTFFGGWVMCEVFSAHRDILSLSLAQFIVGFTLMWCLSPDLTCDMKVGRACIEYWRSCSGAVTSMQRSGIPSGTPLFFLGLPQAENGSRIFLWSSIYSILLGNGQLFE